jgi:hypothetical protein
MGAHEEFGQVKPIPFSVAKEGEHAVFGGTTAKLRHPREVVARYHATSYS